MFNLKNIHLKPKLLGVFLAIGIIPLSLLGWWSSDSASTALNKQAYAQLESIRDIKKNQIERYFEERIGDIQALTDVYNKAVRQAFDNLSATHELKKQALLNYVQYHRANTQMLAKTPCVLAVLQDNPEKQASSFHWLKQSLPLMKYSQAFITDLKGHVIFALSDDAPTQIQADDAQYAALYQSFQAGRQAYHFQDFQAYGSNQEQTAFISAPIQGQGVLILALPTQPLNALMQSRDGMLESGESYLIGTVGQRQLLRSELKTMGEGQYVMGYDATHLRLSYLEQSLDGHKIQNIFLDSAGKPVLIMAHPVDIEGVNWSMVSKIDLEEAAIHTKAGDDIFARYLKLYGYYDIFLITEKGYVFYTVTQESDYHTNLLEGPYKDSHLAQLFHQVKQHKQVGFADFQPYAPSKGTAAFFVAHPVLNQNQQVKAVIAVQLSLQGVNAIMQTRSGMGKTGETYLVGDDYRMRSDSFLDAENRSVQASFAGSIKDNGVQTEAVQQAIAGNSSTQTLLDYRGASVLSAFTPVDIHNIRWALMAEMDVAEVQTPVKKLERVILGLLMGLIIIILFLGWWLSNSLSRPMHQAVDVAQHLGDGYLDIQIHANGKDETAQMLNALQHMLEKLIEIIQQTRNSINILASTSEEISASAQSLSQAASEQAASVEETTSTLELITATVNENAANAQNTQAIAERVRATTEAGGSALMDTVQAMQAIANKIQSVEDIAYKTNLLALNAAIEAARAGDHGRGFAVVASEVQQLAQSSRVAAQDINQLVGDSVKVSQKAGGLLQNILPEIQTIAEQTRSVAMASQQQGDNVEQINIAIRQLDRVSQQNASSAEQLAATAEEMSTQAARLSQIIEFFKLKNTM